MRVERGTCASISFLRDANREPGHLLHRPTSCWNVTTNIPLIEWSFESSEKAKMARWHVIDICSNDQKEEWILLTQP
jgi:hypothetical protein